LIQFAGVAKLHQRRLSDLLRHVICLHGILVIGRWSEISRWIDIHNTGTKRVRDKRCLDYIYSTRPGRQLTLDYIQKVAEQLDAPVKNVAECLRSGEALRCRFLVPFSIKKNDTPDELSAPCKPEWLDPDRDDDDNLLLSKEDEDTAEILISER
jgi:hypothetical protein